MARLPLLHKSRALNGEDGSAAEHLRDLANRLRNEPTPAECLEVAGILDRVASRGKAGWAAAGFAPAKRPSKSARDFAIWSHVRTLTDKGCPRGMAYKRVAHHEGLSEPRVKAICLAYDRAEADAEARD